MASMADTFDPYKALQVDPEADPEVIQAAYRRLAQKYHPDRSSGVDAIARMVAINRAWEILGDPGRRAAHDRERRSGTGASEPTGEGADAPHSSPVSSPVSSPGEATARTARAGAPPSGAQPSGFRSTGFQPPGSRSPEEVSRDWTSGRSSSGFAYDPQSMRTPDGYGAAGPPPGNPSGSVMNFGRYTGWSLGEIARRDLEYLEWLDRMPIGRPYRDEIDAILRRVGRRRSAAAEATDRRGLFRRR